MGVVQKCVVRSGLVSHFFVNFDGMNSKEEQYKSLLAQLASLIEGEREEVSVLSNASALLREVMGDRYFWVGFYLVRDGKLVLGPFQGTVACYRIALGRGVCGTAWQQRTTLVVPDVEQFAGHIACSSLSRSEIVVPLADGDGVVRAVLDIDSRDLAAFDEVDERYLNQAAAMLAATLYG